MARNELKVRLYNVQSGKGTDFTIYPARMTPNGVIDAINRVFKEPKDPQHRMYQRIDFAWAGRKIKLTNPAYTRQDTMAFDGQMDPVSTEFIQAYFDESQKEQKTEEKQKETQPTQPTQPEKKGPWIDELGPSSGLTSLPTTDNPKFDTRNYFDGRDFNQDWQSRWDKMMARSKELETNDLNRRIELYKKVKPAYDSINNLTSGKVQLLDAPKTIYQLMASLASLAIHIVRSIPEEIQAAAGRFANNVDFIGLSVERLYVILTSILEIATNIYKLVIQLDWAGATKLVNKWIADQQKAIQFGIDNKILDDDGDINGPEKWQIPQTAPNSPEEFQKWLAISGLMHSPIIGKMIEDQGRFEVLRQYMERTGVGIPDDYAWLKYILGEQIGVSVPIQDALDLAGQVPDWFLQHTQELSKIGKQVHEAEHREIKQLKH